METERTRTATREAASDVNGFRGPTSTRSEPALCAGPSTPLGQRAAPLVRRLAIFILDRRTDEAVGAEGAVVAGVERGAVGAARPELEPEGRRALPMVPFVVEHPHSLEADGAPANVGSASAILAAGREIRGVQVPPLKGTCMAS